MPLLFPGVLSAHTIVLPALLPFEDTTGCDPLSRHSS
jgi:hypothetical protein